MPSSRHEVRCLADGDAPTLVRQAEMTTSTACRLRAIGASEVLAPAVSGNANADLDFIETGMDAQEPASPAGKRGRSSPTVTSVSRRAWCRESGPPRSREASGSKPWPPTRSNPQILSHGSKPSANAGEREMLRRGIRRSRLVQSGCGEEVLSQSPGGIHGPQFRSGGTVRVKGS